MNINFFNRWNAILGGALLIAGTCIGAGMLGLPVVTAAAGFFPSLSLFVVVWVVMTFTALVFLEVALFLQGETNLISMAQATLGTYGKQIAWVVYLLFLYSIIAAYTSGGTTMLAQLLQVDITAFHKLIFMSILFILPFIIMVYIGARCVDYVNRCLIFGLIAAFAFLAMAASKQQGYGLASFGQAKFLAFTIPLLVTSFGYHLLIPTLKSYLREDVYKLRLAIIIGSLIPLTIYILWEYIILNLVPVWGEHGLVWMLRAKGNPGDLLITALNKYNAAVTVGVAFFAFFALSSSFVGVALGLFDFFADGLQISKTYQGRIWLALLTFVPPVLYTLVYPAGFLLALSYAGVFAAILLIIYPALMAWYGRYIAKMPANYRVVGGKPALFIAIVFGGLVVLVEILEQFNLIAIPEM